MKVIIVAGARPNFMKIAPLIRAMDAHNEAVQDGAARMEYILVHTGQHYDIRMSGVFFEDLDLPQPHVNLEVGSASHVAQIAHIMLGFEPVCLKEKPDWVIVVGDVNSTVACALVAAKLGIRVAHVEAGLRSFDRSMPEELNRILTDSLADLLLTPSPDADENLMREGIPPGKVRRVGNIMIDTLLMSMEKAAARRAYEKFGLAAGDYALVTIHRPANTDDPRFMNRLMTILEKLAGRLPVIFPVHPRTRKQLDLEGRSFGGNLKLVEPLGYLDFIGILAHARFALTDSGGLQEETTFLKVPCLTLRPNTERPVTVTHGTNTLTSLESVEKDIGKILDGSYKRGTIPDLWDGLTGGRIIRLLTRDAAA